MNKPLVLTDAERQRLHSKIEYGTCWQWTAYTTPEGYAEAWFRGGAAHVMHIVYGVFHGPLQAGHRPDHLCRNRACVSPFHLEGVTAQENALRGASPKVQRYLDTHCQRGHAFDAENTRWAIDGTRRCRACLRLGSKRRYREKQMEAVR